MNGVRAHFAGLLVSGLLAGPHLFAQGLSIGREFAPGSVKIVLGDIVADIYVDNRDAKLANMAAGLLADDVQRVTGKRPRIVTDPARLAGHAIFIGSIGNSRLIDRMIAAKKIDVSDVQGRWETCKLQVLDHPVPNVDAALVIAGSDRRGTAYGVFTLSKLMGVSPWYWWADAVPLHQDALVVKPGVQKEGPPSVKYRGIFINDEDWGIQPWAARTFDPQQGDIGPRTYEKVFELLLRLKANYIWPAMHACTTEFGKIDRNITLADEWGIVAGASHPEPMNRNNVNWPQENRGEWRYDTNRRNVLAYWEEWAKKRGPYEAVWTVGMRGVHDSAMIGPQDMPTRVRLLEQAISDQRDLLKSYVNPAIEKVAQLFCPYKEALAQYRAGLRVPDDVTIVWTEDNYGYIRQLSAPQEQKRKGGSGVYYHISYLGSPYSYVWLNTTPPALIWEEMSKAYEYGARQVWILNAGDIKPGEVGIEFWTRLAWNTSSYRRETVATYLTDWARDLFGDAWAAPIAEVMDQYYRLGFARKPEGMTPDLFSLTNYQEADRRLADYQALLRKADGIRRFLPRERLDAYYELVQYPVLMAAWSNEAFISAGYSRHYAQRGMALANIYAQRVDRALAQIDDATGYYNNELAGGKWKHFMTARGTTSERWGYQWPQGTTVEAVAALEDPIGLGDPFGTARLDPAADKPTGIPEFTEIDGTISIEAEHFTRNTARSSAQWQVIPGLGRSGDSVAVYPVTTASIDKSEDIVKRAPRLEYDMMTISSGQVAITTYCLPTRRIHEGRGLRYAIAMDEEQPQLVDFNEDTEGPRWSQNVLRNAAINSTRHSIAAAGRHTLKIWMVDPGVILDKIVVNAGGVKESYLGPPETLMRLSGKPAKH
jgi:hypothetical protein